MWILNSDGLIAENFKGKTIRADYGKDKIFRIKLGYKTIASFKKLSDAKKFIAQFVEQENKI